MKTSLVWPTGRRGPIMPSLRGLSSCNPKKHVILINNVNYILMRKMCSVQMFFPWTAWLNLYKRTRFVVLYVCVHTAGGLTLGGLKCWYQVGGFSRVSAGSIPSAINSSGVVVGVDTLNEHQSPHNQDLNTIILNVHYISHPETASKILIS